MSTLPHDAAYNDYALTRWQALYESPRAWADRGENLYHAFEAVVSASEIDSMHLNMTAPALMLAGMSVELLSKAILINRPDVLAVVTANSEAAKLLTDSEKSLLTAFNNHFLLPLLRESNISLTDEQHTTAEALSNYIIWRGRYVAPTQKSYRNLKPVMLDSGLISHELPCSFESARELFNLVVGEVKAHVY
jgi:hypothetical protein